VPLRGAVEKSTAADPAGMRRRSSGSSEDGDLSPVEAPHVNSTSSSNSALRQVLVPSPTKLEHRLSTDERPSFSISRRSSSINWKASDSRNGNGVVEKPSSPVRTTPPSPLALFPSANGSRAREMEKAQEAMFAGRHQRLRSPWAITILALLSAVTGIGFLFAVVNSSVTRQIDPKGCRMSYMRPSYAKFDDFDTEHTRLASKYSLYLYREEGIDHDTKV